MSPLMMFVVGLSVGVFVGLCLAALLSANDEDSKPSSRLCRHVFVGTDLQKRDEAGNVSWPCSKCGKVFVEPCGLAIAKHGKLTGPWA